MNEDFDELLAQIETEDGPEYAAAEAAYGVLRSVFHLGTIFSMYHPEEGFARPADWNEPTQSEVAETLAEAMADMLSGLRRLRPILKRESVWASLCLANPFPATIGKCHGPNYADAAYRLGMEQFAALYHLIDVHRNLHGVEVDDLPTFDAETIKRDAIKGVENFTRFGKMLSPELDLRLAQEQLAKEAQRATGQLGFRRATMERSHASIPLKTNQVAIVETVRSCGRRLTSDDLLAELAERGLPSSSATKQQFAFLVQLDALTNRTDKFGTGYGLPEWSEKS